MARETLILSPPGELSEADTAEVAQLFARCDDYFLLQDGVPPTLADASALFTDVPPERDANDQIVLGWRGNDRLYGIAAILRDYPHHGIWYLGFMIVDAAQRGRGLGKAIYTTIEDLAVAGGATEIRLAVIEANKSGERFWRSVGFDEQRRVGPDSFKTKSHRRIEFRRHLNGGFVESGRR